VGLNGTSPRIDKGKAEKNMSQKDEVYQKPLPEQERFETREEEAKKLKNLPTDKRLEQIRTRQNREMLRLLEGSLIVD
jgi:hypothetical protein